MMFKFELMKKHEEAPRRAPGSPKKTKSWKRIISQECPDSFFQCIENSRVVIKIQFVYGDFF